MRAPVPLLLSVALSLPISTAGLAARPNQADPPGVLCAGSGPDSYVRTDTGQRNRPPAVEIEEVSTTLTPNGAVVTLRAIATDPDNDKLFYTYTSASGSIAGVGPEVKWGPIGRGSHLVFLEVWDDHGCSRRASFSKSL